MRAFSLLTFGLLLFTSLLAETFDIADFGAREGDRLQTRAIQAAIDAACAAGGGEVVVPAGVYRTGGIRLRTNVTLHLLSGATLEGSRDPEDYGLSLDDTVEPTARRRWNNALIRAVGAHDVTIVGEPHSSIDGMNCYDAQGEEDYRGPHAIGFWCCTNVTFRGYTVRNSANWAHNLVKCRDLRVEFVRVCGGHDGLDIHCCADVSVSNCTFLTGDDGLAGFGNRRVTVRDCLLASSCNAFRFGGTDCLFERCRTEGDAPFGHRYGLSAEERRLGLNHGEALRHGGNVFSYYCDGRWGDIPRPGNLVFRDCDFNGPGRFFICEYDPKSRWCCHRPLSSVRFEDCRIRGVKERSVVFAGAADPLVFEMKDCVVTPSDGARGEPLAEVRDCGRIVMDNVRIEGFRNPVIVAHTPVAVEVRGGTPVTVNRGKSNQGKDR